MIRDLDICDCDCHDGSGAMHCVPCCHPCAGCGERIENGHMTGHKRRCRATKKDAPVSVEPDLLLKKLLYEPCGTCGQAACMILGHSTAFHNLEAIDRTIVTNDSRETVDWQQKYEVEHTLRLAAEEQARRARGWAALWHKRASGHRLHLHWVKETNVALTELAADGAVARRDREATARIVAAAEADRDAAVEKLQQERQAIASALNVAVDDPDALSNLPELVEWFVARLAEAERNRDTVTCRTICILFANGSSAVFNGKFKAMSREAYATRALAEADIPRFRKLCCDPDAGINYAEDDDKLIIDVRELSVRF